MTEEPDHVVCPRCRLLRERALRGSEGRTRGRVVKQVVIPHECAPGWTWKPVTQGMLTLRVGGGEGGHYGVPPTARQYPKGTVWGCDCGRHWVSTGDDQEMWGPAWRRETRRERRRRLGLRWWQREAK